ncbi:AbrB/MazE/SpoVT family DNA-binding domain-containing protein [Rossellomorea vietnamensis]|uniref:AbrB/MazE/SpoVT family DNA-binding domain-containing protein n=1 Tax=Rossellomorea vietnamensis TaxID=218284 RepID=A0A5D4MC79_9BACI|nr:AbrB/MazE/SpoVT family DNA-binding domain-containing protein [Rossellomorea vietnamensis]TYR99098.1 AbrB/MazE/SpoVT family DNA-binding domain-containing protein [Rossellomorea vietnamensis]
MKATGVTRRIDELGRVVIPKELRTTQGINAGDPIEFFVDKSGIVLRPYQTDEKKKSTLTWLQNALSDATNEEDKETIAEVIAYVKQA